MDQPIAESRSERQELLQVVHRESERFYELLVDGAFGGLLVYGQSGERLVLTHTFVAEGYRGRGLGSFLIRGVLDDIRSTGRTITNYCPVLDRFIEKNPEYEALIDGMNPGSWRDRRPSADEALLRSLNDAYIHSDQNGDVARYEEFLAPDFTATLPDLTFRTRKEFLDLIAEPRPFTDLTLLHVDVRILGEVALLHGRVRYTTIHDGVTREALYTDTYQRRDDRWLCVAGEVVARGE